MRGVVVLGCQYLLKSRADEWVIPRFTQNGSKLQELESTFKVCVLWSLLCTTGKAFFQSSLWRVLPWWSRGWDSTLPPKGPWIDPWLGNYYPTCHGAWPKNKWKFLKCMPKKHPWWAENQNFKKKFACKWAEIVAQMLTFVTDVKCHFSFWLNFLHQHDFVKQNYSLWKSRLQSGTSVSSWVFLSSQIVLHIYGQ